MDAAYRIPASGSSARDRERFRRANARLSRIARLLDSSMRMPLTPFRFGMDSIMSIVPVIGSFFGAFVSAYLVLEAYRLGAPRRTLAAMLGNIGVDTMLGSVPILGFFFDAAYKANNRNVALVQAWLVETDRL